MNQITLKCFHCGTKKDICFEGRLQFAFQLAQLANDSSMLGVIDNFHGRSLVFCNQNCLNAEKTKNGSIRVRPIGVKHC